MPIISLFGLWFEWHDPKFEKVNRERGYTLEEIASVFDDDYSITFYDNGEAFDELRLLTIGMSNKFRLTAVSWVERGDTARIITAFAPAKQQEKKYHARRKTNH
ncbi:hypothetical protein B0181_10010 [Moraxella caviae]|uniref:Protein of uncharacterized function (DUF497) n=1 Tax=Moraxella caviae TaxID=34060 RepID=A0A1S9ZVY2_9GAMM|nr:BrnT family toxin [Moraxella caviae]OOR87644.1 hypothetical protein B0181_10010 [Moraxella caviae]STZ10103.1 Protein of uncharacterised function (DUF497) [Moraxella caviae]